MDAPPACPPPDPIIRTDPTHPFSRTLVLLLFFLPMAYLGLIAAMVLHEFIGHGLTAWLWGASFRGVTLHWDGMGWADIDPPRPGPAGIAIMLGGMGTTALVGLGTLAVVAWTPQRFLFLRLALIILAFNCLLEGPPYAFWNAYHPVVPGDVGQLLLLTPHPQLWQAGCLLVGGVLTLGSLFLVPALLLSTIEHWLTPGRNLRGWARALTLLLLTLLITGGEWAFDWNQLAPGLNDLPQRVEIPLQFLIAVVLYLYPWRVSPGMIPLRQGWIAVGFVWLVTLLAVWVMLHWLTQGLKWA